MKTPLDLGLGDLKRIAADAAADARREAESAGVPIAGLPHPKARPAKSSPTKRVQARRA